MEPDVVLERPVRVGRGTGFTRRRSTYGGREASRGTQLKNGEESAAWL